MVFKNEKQYEELKQKAIKMLNESKDKATAIADVVDMFASEKNKDLIEEIQAQAIKANSDSDYASKLGLRVLSKEEESFYEKFKDIKQAITGAQIDLIPTSIVDLTMENVKATEPVLKLITFTPAGVKRWITSERTGAFSWSGLTEELKGELSANVKGLVTDLGKLDAYLIIPKAIRDLSYQFIDKYFMAILSEALKEGIAYGYLQGTGKDQPIGIYKQIDKTNEDGTHQDKTVNNNLTKFTPKGLAAAKVYLSNGGKREINKLYVLCNPEDEANYVAPAIYDAEGNLVSAFRNLEVIPCTENPKGKAALTLENKYTMGITEVKINEYKETLATDDADLIVAKVYANGRAAADNTAYVFDVTKLEEYVPTIKTLATVVSLPEQAQEESDVSGA